MQINRKLPNLNSKPTLISLFAGAGGLDIGLEDAGFMTVAMNDIEDYACATLRENQLLAKLEPPLFESWFELQLQQKCYRNISTDDREALRRRLSPGVGRRTYLSHGAIVEGDIRQIRSSLLLDTAGLKRGELSLVAGGPPCQPFSRAGKRLTVEDLKGQLFMEFVRIVRDLQPRWFLFENVKGLVLSKTEVHRIHCKSCGRIFVVPFELRGSVTVDATDGVVCKCGSANLSIRSTIERDGSLEIIVAEFERIGYRCHWKILNAADFGAPQLRERLFIVGSRDDEPFTWPISRGFGVLSTDNEMQPSLFQDIAINSCRRVSIKEALWPDGHPQYGSLDPDVAVLWVKNVVRPHDEPVTWSLDRPSPTVGAHQAAKLAIAPFGVPEEQIARQQWHSRGRRQGDTPPVPVEHAYLSDLELLKLQTFPEYWYLFGTRMERAFQIGNAVPPILGLQMGKAIMSASGLAYNSASESFFESAKECL